MKTATSSDASARRFSPQLALRVIFATVWSVAAFAVMVVDSAILQSEIWLTLVGMLTFGVGFLVAIVVSTIAMYAHPLLFAGLLTILGAPRWLSFGVAVIGVALVAVVPSMVGQAWSSAMSEDFGAPPRAPRTLQVVIGGNVPGMTHALTCDDACARLLLGGEVDAIEMVVPSGSRSITGVFTIIETDRCPEWQLKAKPTWLQHGLPAGKCVVVDTTRSLPDAPWVLTQAAPKLKGRGSARGVRVSGGPTSNPREKATWIRDYGVRCVPIMPLAIGIQGEGGGNLKSWLTPWCRNEQSAGMLEAIAKNLLGYELRPLPLSSSANRRSRE